MQPKENHNHPIKGKHIRVEPIRKIKDIQTIKNLLKDNPRNYALFVLGVNTNLRAGDLLRLKAHQVQGKKPGDEITLQEQKTKKQRRITLNKNTIEALNGLLESHKYNNDDPLFFSQRRSALTVPTLSRMVKEWCKDINLKGNYASHTLRKTWGYHQRVTFGADIPTLMVCFNHSTQKQTLNYLCIQPDEIKDIYMNAL